jgi:hypothetical protein
MAAGDPSESIFGVEDREHFEREGWVVAGGVVPPENVRRAIDTVCAFHAIVLGDPTTWYRVPPESGDIVPVHHAQAFWDNRSLPSVHRAFADILGTEKLWVSMDRGAFKPPARGHDRVSAKRPRPSTRLTLAPRQSRDRGGGPRGAHDP